MLIKRIMQGLVVFKNDLMSVWKFVVPYRDPVLLPRQWRVATGTQKSYKVDEQRKKKRRLYESNRRKSKPANLVKWHSPSEKEVCVLLYIIKCFPRLPEYTVVINHHLLCPLKVPNLCERGHGAFM